MNGLLSKRNNPAAGCPCKLTCNGDRPILLYLSLSFLAGGKIGLVAGALVGIETGPGAIVTGAIGAIIFGIAGYWGADWIADHISPN